MNEVNVVGSNCYKPFLGDSSMLMSFKGYIQRLVQQILLGNII